MTADCVFCRIVSGEIPGDFVFQDHEMVAFRDIHPVASTHILLVPREHIGSVQDLKSGDEEFIGRLILRAKALAEQEGVAERGYRLVLNCGVYGGQIVPHLHLHLIGGRKLGDSLG
ncbi:MAG: histidine triad nucleotide-binding protein [Dehalococcoidia bacterium]|jgi:histidine triad (HIT) family protein|nr:histidine triad nucleotide-binding protein [Dehalococcoidia bacterium]